MREAIGMGLREEYAWEVSALTTDLASPPPHAMKIPT